MLNKIQPETIYTNSRNNKQQFDYLTNRSHSILVNKDKNYNNNQNKEEIFKRNLTQKSNNDGLIDGKSNFNSNKK